MGKRFVAFGLILLLLLSSVGCWNRREPEEYAWLTWLGLDLTSDNQVRVTVGITPPVSPLPSGSQPEQLIQVSSDTGATVFQAVRNIMGHVPKRVFWGYLRAVFIGENLARAGVLEHLDMLFRDHEVRKNPWVFISKGSTEQIFALNPQIEKNPSDLIDTLVKAEQGGLGKSRVLRLKDLQRELAEPQFDQVVSVIGVWDPDRKQMLAPWEKPPKEAELGLNGSAILQENKLIAWLTPDESQTLLFANGEIKGTIVLLDELDGLDTALGNSVAIEILHSKRELKIAVADDKIYINLKITIQGNLGDQVLQPVQKYSDLDREADLYPKLSQLLQAKIKGQVEGLLTRYQKEKGIDLLDIGDYILTRYPKDWEKIKVNWREYYRDAQIKVEVKANVAAPGTMRAHYPEQEQAEPGTDKK